MGVVRVERAPAAIFTLHADDPFDRPVKILLELGVAGPVAARAPHR